MPLIDLLRNAGDFNRPALFFEDAALSRGDLVRLSLDLAERLSAIGVERGTKVLVALPNAPAFLVSLLAVNERGAVFIPVNPTLSADERRQIDEIARPGFVIAGSGSIELMPGAFLSRGELAPHDDERREDLREVSAIVFTSGTTGKPKGVMLSEDALVANARAVAGYLDLSDNDRTLVFLPLSYMYTLSQVLSTFVAGGAIVLLRNLLYPVTAFAAIAKHGVTGFGGVPTSLNILANHARTDDTPLRYMLSAGGPLAPALIERLQRAFPGVRIFNNYGCTEIGPRATAIDYSAFPEKIGAIGPAIAGVTVTIVRPDLSIADAGEVGEIVLSGPSLMRGYYRDPETTASRMSVHGFHTKDFAYADGDGVLFYQGRADDIFKSGGEKVSAKEIEAVLMGHEAIAEVAVVSLPDPVLGAVPVVYAVLHPGATCSERDLQMFCARRLSKHKVPRSVNFVGELHKTASGKVQKYRLKETHT